jgi:hypothetical protein
MLLLTLAYNVKIACYIVTLKTLSVYVWIGLPWVYIFDWHAIATRRRNDLLYILVFNLLHLDML